MKKILSIALAVIMVFALSVAAFAAEPVTPEDRTVAKEYTLTGGTTTPTETLEFEVEQTSGVEGGATGLPVVGTENKVDITSSTTTTTEFDITFPEYSKVGVYTYTITEKEGSVLGVTYDEDPIYVVVTITNAQAGGEGTADALAATVAIHKGSADGEKLDDGDSAFTNEYGLGQLTVTKQVAGNLASNEAAFSIKVTFTGDDAANSISYTVAGGDAQTLAFTEGKAEVTVQLKNSESAVFTEIPSGVTYTVVEDASHTEGADAPENTDMDKGYTVEYTKSDEEGKIAAGDKDTVTVKNTKETEVDTGIALDSLPYILTAFVVLGATVLMIVRRRRSDEA